MPNDEDKKRWRVRGWQEGLVSSRATAENLEQMLNEFDAEGYEVYDVRFENCIVVGRLKDPEKDDNFGLPMSIGDLLKQTGVEGAVASLQQSQGTPPPPLGEAEREIHEYKVQGRLTPEFMQNLRVVLFAADHGDPFYKERLEQTIRETFGQAPFEEVRKTLRDVEFFSAHHERHTCPDERCTSKEVFEKTLTKLRERLQAHPLS